MTSIAEHDAERAKIQTEDYLIKQMIKIVGEAVETGEREDLLERFRTENKRLQAQIEELKVNIALMIEIVENG